MHPRQTPDDSGVAELGSAFNGMADNLQSLIQSRRELLNAVTRAARHCPPALPAGHAGKKAWPTMRSAMDRDISSIDKMIEELLLYSRLEQARDVLQPQTLTLWPWLNGVVARHAADFPDTDYQLTAVAPALHALTVDADPFYLGARCPICCAMPRAMGKGRVEVSLGADERQCHWIKVADNGPGIPEGERERGVSTPLLRLDRTSRDQRTGGYMASAGLAIVPQGCASWASITAGQRGDGGLRGGACFTLLLAACTEKLGGLAAGYPDTQASEHAWRESRRNWFSTTHVGLLHSSCAFCAAFHAVLSSSQPKRPQRIAGF